MHSLHARHLLDLAHCCTLSVKRCELPNGYWQGKAEKAGSLLARSTFWQNSQEGRLRSQVWFEWFPDKIICLLQMVITFEWTVLQRSEACQNDLKRKVSLYDLASDHHRSPTDKKRTMLAD